MYFKAIAFYIGIGFKAGQIPCYEMIQATQVAKLSNHFISFYSVPYLRSSPMKHSNLTSCVYSPLESEYWYAIVLTKRQYKVYS